MSYAILLLCVVPAVLAFSSGPPVQTVPALCTDMIPAGHNGGVSLATDQDSPPYVITTTASQYTTGGSIMVTITGTGGNQFRGFFIQARRADPSLDNDVAIGTFSSQPASTQLLTCHNVANSAWGHSLSSDRSTITATWNAPAQDEGPIEFKATIVKGVPDRNYFYTGVMSAQVSFMAGAGVTGTVETPSGDMTTSVGNMTTSVGGMTTLARRDTPSVAGEVTTQASTTSSGTTHVVSFASATLVIMLAAFLGVGRY